MDMNELSVQSDEDKIEQESVEEMEQKISHDEEKNTPLARRTSSARASKPSRFVLPSAILPDESDDEFVERSHNTIPKGKPTNILPSSTQETPPQETDAESCTWITGPTTHSGTESTEPSTDAIAQEGGDRSDEVQPKQEPPDGP